MTPDEEIPEPVRQGSFLFAFIPEDHHATSRIEPVRMKESTYRRIRRGGNLPPATLQIQPVWLNRTTPCSGGNLPPSGPPGAGIVVHLNL